MVRDSYCVDLTVMAAGLIRMSSYTQRGYTNLFNLATTMTDDDGMCVL